MANSKKADKKYPKSLAEKWAMEDDIFGAGLTVYGKKKVVKIKSKKK